MIRAEILLAKRWTKAGKSPNAIAILLDRCPKTVRKNLAPKGAAATRVGRPKMTETEYAKCDAALNLLQLKAKGTKEITAAMVKKKSGVKYCCQVIQNGTSNKPIICTSVALILVRKNV